MFNFKKAKNTLKQASSKKSSLNKKNLKRGAAIGASALVLFGMSNLMKANAHADTNTPNASVTSDVNNVPQGSAMSTARASALPLLKMNASASTNSIQQNNETHPSTMEAPLTNKAIARKIAKHTLKAVRHSNQVANRKVVRQEHIKAHRHHSHLRRGHRLYGKRTEAYKRYNHKHSYRLIHKHNHNKLTRHQRRVLRHRLHRMNRERHHRAHIRHERRRAHRMHVNMRRTHKGTRHSHKHLRKRSHRNTNYSNGDSDNDLLNDINQMNASDAEQGPSNNNSNENSIQPSFAPTPSSSADNSNFPTSNANSGSNNNSTTNPSSNNASSASASSSVNSDGLQGDECYNDSGDLQPDYNIDVHYVEYNGTFSNASTHWVPETVDEYNGIHSNKPTMVGVTNKSFMRRAGNPYVDWTQSQFDAEYPHMLQLATKYFTDYGQDIDWSNPIVSKIQQFGDADPNMQQKFSLLAHGNSDPEMVF